MKRWAIAGRAFMAALRIFGDRQFARRTGQRAAGRRGQHHDRQRQHIGGGVEEIVAFGDADRLQRRADGAGAAEQQRRREGTERVPAREDHQSHRHQALPRRDALGPAPRIIERQVGAADGGQRAAGRGGQQAHGVRVETHGAGGIGAVADDADDQADAGVAEGPVQGDRQRDAQQEQDIHVECGLHLRDRRPPAERDRRQMRRHRLDEGLAEEESEAEAELHQGDADGDVVHLGEFADPAMEQPENAAGRHRRRHTEPGRAGDHRRAVGDHGAEDQRAFEAEIDAAGALGDRLAQRDEDEWRRDADGAAQHGERHAPQADLRCVAHVSLRQRSGLRNRNRP
jgi:hypothetical protein